MTSSVSSLSELRVLTVGGSAGLRAFLLDLMSPRVASVRQVSDVAEALQLMRDGERFDLKLVDVPETTPAGLAVVREPRVLDDECTVAAMVGSGEPHAATSALSQGADGCVEKQHLSPGGENELFFVALEQAVARRADQTAARQLEAAKADFYSMVTHDLRNPAGNVLVALRMLLSGKAGELRPRQRDLAALAQRSAEKFVGLITDYLDYAKIDAGYLRLDREPTDLAAVVRDSVEQARTQAEVRSQRISVEAPEALTGVLDAAKVGQVLDNLLSNAIKYTPDGGRISVSLERVDDGRSAVIRVGDTGRGIPADQLPVLFTKYHRVPGQSTSAIQGTGLGLLIIKEIVQAHRGSAHAESTGVEGDGSAFVIRLPLDIA